MSNHRHCHCSIVPPHILEHISKNGTAKEKSVAAANLALIERQRIVRSTLQRLPRVAALTTFARPHKERTIYDAQHANALPGKKVRGEGDAATGDAAADEAYDGLGATFDLYWDVYQRDSIDDAGLPLVGSVHFGTNYDNAYWNGQQMVFGDGDGTIFNRFTVAIDIMGHELTHGVTGDTAQLNYNAQSGALNESISDVFGSLVKQHSHNPPQTADNADWLIGAGIFVAGINGTALRSMKAPGTAYDDPKLGKDPQPAHMKDYVNTTSDNGGVHINSGIPNHAFYNLAVSLGGFAWERAGNIWYRTLLDPRLKANAQFQDFANLSADVASHIYGKAEKQAVIDAWQEVGIEVYDETKWVTSLYADLLSRAPDKSGLDGWVGARLGGASLRDVIDGFLNSVEYCTSVVTALYQDLLGRLPDPGGLQGWVKQLEAGTARHDILIGFLDSAEYKSKNAPPAAFVESLYQKLLGRASDPNGKQGWIDALAAGASTADVIKGFLFSQEYCTQRVTELYQVLLGRAPDTAGLASWVALMTKGTRFQDIQYGFLASTEYRTRSLVRFSDERSWISALYSDLLSRTPANSEVDGWVTARIKGASLRDVVDGFLNSAEYCTSVVTLLYQDILGRQPDANGLAAWVGQLENGVARQTILRGFLDSAEYKATNVPPAPFVESLYQRLLGRASDANGKQGWINALANGDTTADVINGFLFSQEYCTQRVTELYANLLGRTPDVAGLKGWVALMSGGARFQDIQYGFLASTEYRARALVRFSFAMRTAMVRSKQRAVDSSIAA